MHHAVHWKWPVLLLWVCVLSGRAEADRNPVEIGTVSWQTDYRQALAQAKEENKPVFLLFQEVPGCAGCQQFGREVLSDPALVQQIEAHFIPLVVYNNRGGAHEAILKKYREPAWNYQVVRFVDAQGRDIIPRKDKVWTKQGIAARMVKTLEAVKQPVPAELHRLAGRPVPGQGRSLMEAAFAQSCFWTGEARLGGLEGVLATEVGFIGHREVTRVKYDPEVISYAALHRKAGQLQCADEAYPEVTADYRKAPAHDQKKQIQGTRFMELGLSPYQLTKVNAFARKDLQKALVYLSEEQRQKLRAGRRQ